MKRLLATIVLVTASHMSFGCSYDLRLFNSVEKKFMASDIVALAEVITSKRELFQYKDGTPGTREVVDFRVKEVFMGDVQPGSRIVTSTDIGSSCALNVLNSPPILESVDGLVKLGKRWVLYLNSGRPYELVQIPGSFPAVRSNELVELRRLRHKYGPRKSAS
jgi:hypothetical protein